MERRDGLTFALCSLLAALPAAAQDAAGQGGPSLSVEVVGLDAELTENARAHLSLLALEQADLQRNRVIALHRQATGEIREALEPYGYHRPEIESELELEGASWTARYRVRPGPPLRLEEVSIELLGPGRSHPALEVTAATFPLGEGDVLVQPRYEEGKAAIEEAAASHGFLEGEFETAAIGIDPAAYEAAIALVYHTGPQYVFGPTRFEPTVLAPELLRGYIPYDPGEPFDHSALLALERRLDATPWFESVEVEARRAEAVDRRVPIRVRLVPAKPRAIRGGIGYGTDTGVRGRGAFEWRRVNRRAHQASAEVLLSELEARFEARYRIPAPYPRTQAWSFAAGYAEDELPGTRAQTALASAEYTRARELWRESYGLLYSREDFEIGAQSAVSDLLMPQAFWSRVESDDRVYASWGRRFDFAARAGAEDAFSDHTFLQLETRARYIRSLGDLRVILRGHAGWTGSDDLQALPPSLRFFAGGDQSVRGYDLREISPVDAEGEPIGGPTLLTASIELDSLFLELGRFGRFGAAVFYDAGGVGDDLGDELLSGAGAGLRWLSPIGQVRLDAAWALDRAGEPMRLHVSIGPDF